MYCLFILSLTFIFIHHRMMQHVNLLRNHKLKIIWIIFLQLVELIHLNEHHIVELINKSNSLSNIIRKHQTHFHWFSKFIIHMSARIVLILINQLLQCTRFYLFSLITFNVLLVGAYYDECHLNNGGILNHFANVINWDSNDIVSYM